MWYIYMIHETLIMEGQQQTVGMAPAASKRRWKPTVEQINILEMIYSRQGVTTPTTGQILQIARRLREFGSVEGKNVFYWFQNRKARQRQRHAQYLNGLLLQEAMAAGSCCFLLPHAMHYSHHQRPSTCAFPTAFCIPSLRARWSTTSAGYYARFPQALDEEVNAGEPTATHAYGGGTSEEKVLDGNACHLRPDEDCSDAAATTAAHQTLQLFPLHPTGVLGERSAG